MLVDFSAVDMATMHGTDSTKLLGMCYVVSDEKRETRWKAVPHEVFHSPLRIQRSAKRTNHRRDETAIRRNDHSAGKSHNGETEREFLSASAVNAYD